jgi:hypothetical protein
MARIFLVSSASVAATVGATTVAAHTALAAAGDYQFASTTNCWIRQGTSKLVTCATKANMVDGETLVIVAGTSTKTYEFDVNGTGVTAGNVQVNISGATTAASVAVILRTAILANQTALTVTDPTNGTLIVDLPDSTSLTITDTVAHASFTIGTGIMQATAGTGSTFVPANYPVLLKGVLGGQLGVIQNAAGGTSSTTRVMIT